MEADFPTTTRCSPFLCALQVLVGSMCDYTSAKEILYSTCLHKG